MNTLPQMIAGANPGSAVAQGIAMEQFKNAIFADLHVANIGVVVAFDEDTNSLTVKPIVNERLLDNKGNVQWVDFPEVEDTPYISFGTTQPNPGDPCLLIYTDYDFSAWWNGSATQYSGKPKTHRQAIQGYHNTSNIVAIMGLQVKGTYDGTTHTNTEITGTATDNGTGVSEKLITFLKSWEGFVETNVGPTAHSLDYWNTTVGYGHILMPTDNFTFPLTKAKAEEILRSDLVEFINSVKKEFAGCNLTQNQFDALVSISENNGAYMWKNANLTTAVKKHASADVIKRDFEAWCHVGKTEAKGLLRRRTAEAAMFNTGVYQNND